MSLALPDSFPELIRSTFNSAKESGALLFSESTDKDIVVQDLTFNVRIVPALGQKPVNNKDNDDVEKPKKKFDPFETPEPALFLCSLGEKYSIILNKFSILPYHYLCVTTKFESQNAPLSEDDLIAAWACLQADLDPNMRQLAFYNCGERSGASQAHKHLQFISVSKQPKLLPDVALSYGVPESKDAIGQFPTYHPAVPFAHFVLPLPPNPTGNDLVMRFSSLLARTLNVLRRHEQRDISFNFAMTKEWIFVAPRSQESADDISINATGMIGLMLAKSDEQMEQIKTRGPLELLLSVGVDRVIEDEAHHDY
ncbi:ATP adenylyltransferase-domain-containing protein [Lipomyces arxii]|uniref:ATP adenylyltransferase-domain-containing protein n=1 Tax=Lipomyces arxii TaxID=56418 RepID=UPI0034CF1908